VSQKHRKLEPLRGPNGVQNWYVSGLTAHVRVLRGPTGVQNAIAKVLCFQRGLLQLADLNGGDDGARTRDLRRDRFEVWSFHFNDLPVLSMA